jgi:hypothetical protein
VTPLELAAQHVARGERIVARQLLVIEWLRTVYLDTYQAEQLLLTFEGTLSIFRNHYEALLVKEDRQRPS